MFTLTSSAEQRHEDFLLYQEDRRYSDGVELYERQSAKHKKILGDSMGRNVLGVQQDDR